MRFGFSFVSWIRFCKLILFKLKLNKNVNRIRLILNEMQAIKIFFLLKSVFERLIVWRKSEVYSLVSRRMKIFFFTYIGNVVCLCIETMWMHLKNCTGSGKYWNKRKNQINNLYLFKVFQTLFETHILWRYDFAELNELSAIGRYAFYCWTFPGSDSTDWVQRLRAALGI